MYLIYNLCLGFTQGNVQPCACQEYIDSCPTSKPHSPAVSVLQFYFDAVISGIVMTFQYLKVYFIFNKDNSQTEKATQCLCYSEKCCTSCYLHSEST